MARSRQCKLVLRFQLMNFLQIRTRVVPSELTHTGENLLPDGFVSLLPSVGTRLLPVLAFPAPGTGCTRVSHKYLLVGPLGSPHALLLTWEPLFCGLCRAESYPSAPCGEQPKELFGEGAGRRLTFSAKTWLPESSVRCKNSKCRDPNSARMLLLPAMDQPQLLLEPLRRQKQHHHSSASGWLLGLVGGASALCQALSWELSPLNLSPPWGLY